MDTHNQLYLEHPFLIRSFILTYRCDDWEPPVSGEARLQSRPYSQLVYLTKGEALYTIGGVSYPVKAGEMVYRPADIPYCYQFTTEKVSLALVTFRLDSPSMAAFLAPPFPLYGEEISTFLELVDTARRIVQPVRGGSAKKLEIIPGIPPEVTGFVGASLERFLSMVYCRLKGISLVPDRSRKTVEYREEEKLAAGIKAYLREHGRDPISLDVLAKHFGVAKTSLCRSFKRQYNRSILDWIAESRIQRAKELLELSSLSFAEIAESLGYSPNYFSRIFKKKTGMTPTEFSRRSLLLSPPLDSF